MLYWIDDDRPVLDIPKRRQNSYYSGLKKLTNGDEDLLRNHINSLIDRKLKSKQKEIEFLVPGWEAGTEWGYPLDIIWEKVYPGNIKECGKWYGLFVMNVIIDRTDKWYCNKTNFNRPFDQIVYWIKEF